MKKIFILLAAICLCSCDNSANTTPSRKNNDTSINVKNQLHRSAMPNLNVVEIEGHAYIIIGPVNNPRIVHAEHCPCKNK